MDEEVNVETVPVVDDIVPVVDETNSVQGRNSPRYTPRAEEVDPDSVPPNKLPVYTPRLERGEKPQITCQKPP